jgi:hypothetical protein
MTGAMPASFNPGLLRDEFLLEPYGFEEPNAGSEWTLGSDEDEGTSEDSELSELRRMLSPSRP